MIDRRHIDQMATRQRDMRGNARPLGTDRLFGNLHQDLLPFFKEILDRWQLLLFDLGLVGAGVVAINVTGDFVHLIKDIGNIKKGGFFEADIDKCSLHSGQNPDHAAFVDIADYSHFALALNVEFGNMPPFEKGHTGFVRRGVDYQFPGHDGLRFKQIYLKKKNVCH